PDQLADLERKVSVRFSAALAEIRQEMRRAVEAQAQRASSAMLADLDAIRPPAAEGFLAAEDLHEVTREAGDDARRNLARGLHKAVVEFDRARSQNGVLEALLSAARPFGDHAALWLMRPEEIVGWASRGFASDPPRDPIAGCTLSHQTSPALARLATGRGGVELGAAEAAQLAHALEIAAPARALFLPLVLRDRVAAALYLDSATAGEFEIEALQMLTLAAAQRLELQALSTRSYTPTLFLDADAPANESGLALWDPTVPASGATVAEGAEAATVEEPEYTAAAPTVAGSAAPEYAWEGSPEEVAETAITLSSTAPFEPAEMAVAPVTAGEEIAWQMEEANESALIGSAPGLSAPAATDWLTAAPSDGLPLSHATPEAAPAADAFAPSPAAEWQEVEEATAPHSTFSPAATQRFPTSAVTNEFPQPDLAVAPDLEALPPNAASTIAFVPPADALDVDLADDATVRIQRSSLQPPAPPAAPIAPIAPAEPARPTNAGAGVHDDEPTISRGPRTTEVAPPADLQGPGWAFSSARAPRASGDNALHEEARRLARLLVSEIKLYNEDQVEEGRHNRDIYHRLKDDIDRSRQIYEERVHESVRGTTDYFQQELIRSLAGGDSRALGI
ncbi:MAG: hypothetical protein ABI689_08735, partial [Thermoanaerobaculia bacterium]